MASELDLQALLTGMKPEMQPGIFVFCTISEETEIPAATRPLLTFREREGTTLRPAEGSRKPGSRLPVCIAPDHFDRSFLA